MGCRGLQGGALALELRPPDSRLEAQRTEEAEELNNLGGFLRPDPLPASLFEISDLLT